MGHTVHHAIIVTTYSKQRMDTAYNKALEIFPTISHVIETTLNGWYTFCIPTDGSKEWWPESDAGDERRTRFLDWLNTQRFEDGSTPYSWVELEYGSDDPDDEPAIVRHNRQAEAVGNLE